MRTAGSDAQLARTFAAIERELEVVRLDGHSPIASVLPAMRQLADLESLVVLAPTESLTGFELTRWEADGLADSEGFRDSFAAFWRASPRRYAWYDPICPEREQRNRVLEAHDLMGPGEFEQSAVYERVLRPHRMHRHRQPRALLCDGPSLLAWFGAFHDGAVTARQMALLRRFARPVRARLAIERTLSAAVRQAALAAALEQLGAPALVLVGERVANANASGQALLRTHRDEVREALQGGCIAVDRIAIEERGCPSATLAIFRGCTRDARISACVARVVADRNLTARQAQILDRVLRGDTSATIAAELGVTSRAVELHVSTLLARFEVENRSALVAAVLASA